MQIFALGLLLMHAPAPELDYEALARKWMERHGVAAESPTDLTVERLLDEHFVSFQLGAIDIRIPPAPLADPKWSGELQEAFRALAAAQARWVGWLPEGAPGKDGIPKDLKASLKTLDGWLKGWGPRELVALDEADGQGIFDALGTKDKVREAAASFSETVVAKGSLAKREAKAQIVLIPDRADFVEFTALIGWIREDIRHEFWVDGINAWTFFYHEKTKILALEYANPHKIEDYSEALEMTFKNERATAEHIVQIASMALIEATCGETVEPILVSGLANKLTIDVFGEVDTRNDGDLRAKITEGVSVFIPGALSDGSLPPVDASSRWREDKGGDYFVPQLKLAQKDGAKESRSRSDRLTTFVLKSDDEKEEHVLQAPFLAPGSADSIPSEFRGDLMEFLRAYRVAFLNWLREESEGRKSHESFARLLGELGAGKSSFPEAVETVYGAPLSGSPADASVLEGRFLAWLSKAK